MRVYRVEDREGRGPYVHCVIPDVSPTTADPRPMPFEDGIVFTSAIANGERYGFASRLQVRKWFTLTERRSLADNGFRLVEYEVPYQSVQVGGAQVAFDVTRAKRIRSNPLIRKGAKRVRSRNDQGAQREARA